MKTFQKILFSFPIRVICRLALGGVFLVAAMGKLDDPVRFLGNVADYKLLPSFILPFFTTGLPGVELVCAIGLIAGFEVRAYALVTTGMMLMFMAALFSAILRNMDLDCSCFDLLRIADARVGWGTLGRDAIFLIPCLILVFAPEYLPVPVLTGPKRSEKKSKPGLKSRRTPNI
jgi:putative oxidoreductase